jgi:SH3-like domain-containing protein
MRTALRHLLVVVFSVLLAPLATGSPATPDPVPQPRPKPIVEAALHSATVTAVPPPMVASGLPVPRWVTIKAPRVNVRRGPSLELDVLWTYVKPGLPVEVIAEYDTWRRIRDADGGVGWVKAAMLDGRRNVVITGNVNTAILETPTADADAVAIAGPGLIAKLVACERAWCEISTRGYDGYVTRDRLWGVYESETVR